MLASYLYDMSKFLLVFSVIIGMACFFTTSAFAQSSSTSENIDFTSLNTGNDTLTLVTTNSAKIGQMIYEDTTLIAKTIMKFVLVTELMWMSCRIALGSFLVEQLSKFFIRLFVVWIMLYGQYPQQLLIKSRQFMFEGGKQIASQIVQLTNIKGESPEEWWGYWITGNSDSESTDTTSNKMSREYISKTIFSKYTSSDKASYMNDLDKGEFDKSMANAGKENRADSISKWVAMTTGIGQMISTILNCQIISTTTPVVAHFVSVGIIAGADISFWLLLSLGIAVLPLALYNLFSQIPSIYLHALMGTVLVPCLFYIMSATGIVITDSMFQGMFPENGSTKVQIIIANAMNSFTKEKVDEAVNMVLGEDNVQDTSNLSWWDKLFHSAGDTAAGAIRSLTGLYKYLMPLFIFWNTWMVGIMIVAGFVTMGVAFASAVTVAAAYTWNRGFEGIYQAAPRAIENAVSSLGGQITSGITQIATAGLSGMFQTGGGIAKTLRGGK